MISQQANSIAADHRAKRSSNIHHDNDILDFPLLPCMVPYFLYILPLLKSELRTFRNLLEPFLMSEKRHWQGFQNHIKRMYYTPCVISLLTESISGITATLLHSCGNSFSLMSRSDWISFHGITWPKVQVMRLQERQKKAPTIKRIHVHTIWCTN